MSTGFCRGVPGRGPESADRGHRDAAGNPYRHEPGRGWIGIAAGFFGLFAILAWPNLEYVALCLAVAAGLVLVAIWVHVALPVAELEAHRRRVTLRRGEHDSTGRN